MPVTEISRAQYEEFCRLMEISIQLRQASRSADCTLKEKIALQAESRAYNQNARAIICDQQKEDAQ